MNLNGWGRCLTAIEVAELEEAAVDFVLDNEKRKIDDFLFGQLPHFRNRVIKVKIEQNLFQHSLKYRIKKALGKKVPQYYSLRKINDKFLLQLISFYRNFPYSTEISVDLKSIIVSIKFP